MTVSKAWGDVPRCNKCGQALYDADQLCPKCYPDGYRNGRD